MAGSRLEKLSTIFARYTGLLRSGAVLEKNRPIWYDIYKEFPPKVEPLAIRPEPVEELKSIYYPEDIIRSRFARMFDLNRSNVVYDFVSSSTQSSTASSSQTPPKINISELFVAKYLQLARDQAASSSSDNVQATIDLNNAELYAKTEDLLRKEFGVQLKHRHATAEERRQSLKEE